MVPGRTVAALVLALVLISGCVGERAGTGPAPTIVPTVPPPSSGIGEPCSDDMECLSDNCRNGICCLLGRDCCSTDRDCDDGNRCDADRSFCVPRPTQSPTLAPTPAPRRNGMMCDGDHMCLSGNCGAGVCCLEGNACCLDDRDCGPEERCDTDRSYCVAGTRQAPTPTPGSGGTVPQATRLNGMPCAVDDECLSDNCINGVCCTAGRTCCQDDRDCPGGMVCDHTGSACAGDGAVPSSTPSSSPTVTPVPNGGDCHASGECASGNCAGGVCCLAGTRCCRTDADCPPDHACDTDRSYCVESQQEPSPEGFHTVINEGTIRWQFPDNRGETVVWNMPVDIYRTLVSAPRPVYYRAISCPGCPEENLTAPDYRTFVRPEAFTDVIGDLTDDRTARQFIDEVYNLKNRLMIYQVTNETAQWPLETLTEGRGSCRDSAVLMAALIMAGNGHASYGMRLQFAYVDSNSLSVPLTINHVLLHVTFSDGASRFIETTARASGTMDDAGGIRGWFLPYPYESCADGTPAGTCAAGGGHYCEPDGTSLIPDCALCGCPDGLECYSDDRCYPPDRICDDGTYHGSCSEVRPFLCVRERRLVPACQVCGCPLDAECGQDGNCWQDA